MRFNCFNTLCQIYFFSVLVGILGFDVGCDMVVCISDSSSPLLSPSVCLPLSICGVVDCEVLLLVSCFHISNIFIPTFADICQVDFSVFSLNPGIIIFLSNCRGH